MWDLQRKSKLCRIGEWVQHPTSLLLSLPRVYYSESTSCRRLIFRLGKPSTFTFTSKLNVFKCFIFHLDIGNVYWNVRPFNSPLRFWITQPIMIFQPAFCIYFSKTQLWVHNPLSLRHLGDLIWLSIPLWVLDQIPPQYPCKLELFFFTHYYYFS